MCCPFFVYYNIFLTAIKTTPPLLHMCTLYIVLFLFLFTRSLSKQISVNISTNILFKLTNFLVVFSCLHHFDYKILIFLNILLFVCLRFQINNLGYTIDIFYRFYFKNFIYFIQVYFQ